MCLSTAVVCLLVLSLYLSTGVVSMCLSTGIVTVSVYRCCAIVSVYKYCHCVCLQVLSVTCTVVVIIYAVGADYL